MDWKSNLRRTQSLKSVASSCDAPVWTEAGLRDRKTSVSQLVARYQTAVKVSRPIDVSSTNCVEPKLKPGPQETTQKSTTTTTTSSPNVSEQLAGKPEHTTLAPLLRNEEKECPPLVKTNLTRSKSMVSLQQHSSGGGTGALRALFESKRDTPRPVALTAARPTAPPSTADTTPEAKGGLMGNETPTEKREGGLTSAGASIATPDDDAEANAKGDGATLKVVNKTRTERRRTIGGVDFEKNAFESEDKRRSIADFRDSSLIQASGKLPASVKSISALYLSKVAAAEPRDSLLKPAQNHSSGFGKRVKMADDPRQIKEDAPLPQRGRFQPGAAGDVPGTHVQPTLHSMPPQQPSKEQFYQQRQKCELRRLLKHTHPELKTLDGVVDEELAEVLSLEQTAAETGYEGEVLSRRWLFEQMRKTEAPHATKTHMEEGTAEGGDVRRTPAQNERTNETLEDAQRDTSANDRDAESEEMVRIDVRSARKMFESQSVDNIKPSSESSAFQGKVEDETGAVQNRKQKFEKKGKKLKQHRENSSVLVENLDSAKQCHKQEPCIPVVGSGSKQTFYENQEHKKGIPAAKPVIEDQSVRFPNSFGDSFEETEGFEETVDLIRTSADLFQNNPFISTNMNREKPQNCETKGQSSVSHYGDPAVDNRASEAQVKNRTHLFESMPFHQIMHQNREEMETVVERINQTLNSLYHFNAIHSDGSVIEVHETMIATKAKYRLSQTGPEIQYDEVAEGGANNFILQLLPRANLKPHVIYLKEDKEGNVAFTPVGVPVHQHQFNAKQDTEFKTVNAVQLIEDILYQDNSLKKGVIIQEDEVTVYSLYHYAEGDVKGYCPPPQGCGIEPCEPAVSAVTNDGKIGIQDVRGDVKSTISCLLANAQDQGCPVSIMPDTNMRGNVKLFSSCIEKGDLEYLKTLQAEPSEQEPCPDQTQALARDDTETCRQEDHQEDDPEWVPVDVKKLRNMFSADPRPVQPKPIVRSDALYSTKLSPGLTCQSKAHGKGGPSSKCDTHVFSYGQSQEVVHNADEIGHLQAADSASDTCGEGQQGTEVVQKGHLKAAIKSLQSPATELHQEDKEEVVPGNLQSALDSLERSSINVSKGDFKAAMIYRGSSKSDRETSKTVCVQNPAETESKSASCVDFGQLTTEEQSSASTDTDSASDTCAEGQQGTEVVQKGHLKAAIKSLQSAATELHQEDKEEVVPGNLQSALDSLEKSSINVARGDFRAAMIYRGSSKSHRETCKTVDAMSARNPAENKVGLLTESKSAEPCETLGQQQQVVDDERELCHLQAAICSLQQATNEAKELSKLHIASVARRDVEVANAAKVQAGFPTSDKQKQNENMETNCTDTDSASDTCAEGQQGTEVVQKGHLKAAIKSLQSAATEMHQEDKEEVVPGNLQSALDSLERSNINVSKGDFKAAMIYRDSSKSNRETCKTVCSQNPAETESKSASCVDFGQLTTEEQSSAGTDTDSASDTCAEGQQGTEVVQKGHLKAAIKSLQSAATELHQEDKEEVVPGNLQSALDSLERSSINVSKGDFKAAMIYRGSSKCHKETCKTVSVKNKDELLTKSKSAPCPDFGQLTTEELSSAVAETPSQTTPVPATGPSSKMSRGVTAAKPALPPKPAHLKPNHANNELKNSIQISPTTAEIKESKEEQPPQSLPTRQMSYKDALTKGLSQTDCTTKSSPNVLDCEKCDANQPAIEAIQMSEEIQLTSSKVISGASSLVHEGNISQPEGMPITSEEKPPQNDSAKDDENAVEECPVDFQEARKKFGGGKNVQFKIAPVKPKRVRIVQNENKIPEHSSGHDTSTILTHTDAEPHVYTGPTTCSKPNVHEHTSTNNSTDKDNSIQTSKVVMREKKVRIETEDERLQRLSVHMDEIMRGNMTAAMEIFDNLRKQEELQNILTKVEEIEQDTRNVDVSSLRSVFENVPEWVVTSQAKKPKQAAKVEHRVKTAPPQNTESMSSMAHAFGDLERASEEIMNLKEQTLARLVDIEDAIKKALRSVSNLKSDSDIAGLSGLFKQSLGTSGNISQISIGSSRTATSQTQHQSLTTQRVTGLQVDQRPGSEAPGPNPHASPPSSPAFIQIQSAARKNDKTQVVTPETSATYPPCQHSPNTPEKFRSTKTLTCNSAAQGKKRDPRKGGQKQNKHSKHEVSVLEVQTDHDGNSVAGTKTENYERKDDSGNGVYTSKISTVVTTQK